MCRLFDDRGGACAAVQNREFAENIFRLIADPLAAPRQMQSTTAD
jgi:hypothetical protein